MLREEWFEQINDNISDVNNIFDDTLVCNAMANEKHFLFSKDEFSTKHVAESITCNSRDVSQRQDLKLFRFFGVAL